MKTAPHHSPSALAGSCGAAGILMEEQNVKKLSVCVLFGGVSPEHEVSLRSAESVLNNLDKEKYNIFPVGITKTGEWNDVCTDREGATFLRIWQAASKALGKDVELTVMTGWGEGGFMNLYGIPVVYFGPGENGMSHRPEEQIHVDEIKKVALAYEQIINEVCGMKRNTLEEVLKQTGIMVADGAMATELERMGCDLNDSLWSAKVLAEQPELIGKVHRSYFEAGADCGITASYQATIDGFCKRGYTEAEAEELIRRSVDIMVKEREDWWQAEGKDAGRAYPLVCASVGPYGAYLADGSEYRGNYGVSKEDLRNFHKCRMELLWDAGADLFAVETIPCLEEAIVAAELTQEMNAACWISFSCNSGGHHLRGDPDRRVRQVPRRLRAARRHRDQFAPARFCALPDFQGARRERQADCSLPKFGRGIRPRHQNLARLRQRRGFRRARQRVARVAGRASSAAAAEPPPRTSRRWPVGPGARGINLNIYNYTLYIPCRSLRALL